MHGDSNTPLGSDRAGVLVAGIDVPDDAHARIVDEHPFELLRRQLRPVGHTHLARVDGTAHPDATIVVYHSGWELAAPEGPFQADLPPEQLRGVDRFVASLRAA